MKKVFSLSLLLFIGSFLFAQLPGTNDPTFNVLDNGVYGDGTGFDGSILCTTVQPDGTILVGGNFTYYNNTLARMIARLNPDGSLDTSFRMGTGFSYSSTGNVRCIKLQPDGKIIVAGQFSNYNGTNIVPRLTRLNADGTIDPTFIPSTVNVVISTGITSMAVQPDGKIILGGHFTTYGSATRNKIMRINGDGSLDQTFVHTTGFNGNVSSLALQPDGKVVVVGDFTTYNGSAREKIARINPDGTLDLTFFPGTGFSNSPASILLLNSGKMIVTGSFTSYNGTTKNRIVRLHPNGDLDASFNSGNGFNNGVTSIFISSDDKIFLAGSFTSYNGTLTNYVAKLDSSGSIDPTFNVGTGASTITYITGQNDGKIIVGGNFSTFNQFACSGIVRLDPNGAVDIPFSFSPGFNGDVECLVIQPDGKIIVGGDFVKFNGKPVNRLVRLLPDGLIDTTFNIGSGANAIVNGIKLQGDGRILIIGEFSSYNGITKSRIARLNPDGSLDNTFHYTGFSSSVNPLTLDLQSDGKVVVGGNFGTVHIRRLNTDGTIDNSFTTGTGFTSSLNELIVLPDDKIIAIGNFGAYNGITRNRIIRINANGTIDPTFDPGTGVGGQPYDMSVQPDGKTVVVGTFTTYNTITRNRIVRINTDGSIDLTFDPGTGFVYSSSPTNTFAFKCLLESDGKIIVEGQFNSYNGIARTNLARILPNGTIDPTFKPYPAFNNRVRAMEQTTDGKIVVGGRFAYYTTVRRNKIARILGGDCNPSSSLNITACNSYSLNGQTYNTSGTYTQSIPNFLSCDSVITLNLTLKNSTSSSLTSTICGASYTLNGHTYTSSGNYTQILTNIAGCDSTIALNLTLTGSNTNLNVEACNSYNLNGTTYTNSGNYVQSYTNVLGCDSLYNLNLTINHNTSSTLTRSACNSYTLNGSTYNSSGTYMQTINNSNGCDSVITLNLTIRNASASTINATACSAYTLNNQTYSASGTYTQTRTNSVGCDSVITLNLTIVGDVVVNQSWNILTAPAGGTYQWINCQTNSIIPNETGQSYTVTIPGSYAVMYTQGPCMDISPCITYTTVGIDEASFAGQISVFPNPSSGYFTVNTGNIASDISIEILNLFGEKVPFSRVNNQGSFNLEISGAAGIYFVAVSSDGNKAILKLVKQ